MDAEEIIRLLDLTPHPEGGAYRETHRSREIVPTDRGPRAASTAILFLLRRGSFSALHRIRSDEAWCFHLGAPLHLITLLTDGARVDHVLGPDLRGGQVLQAIVPAGAWFGAELVAGAQDFALVTCTVAPGFDFADFELGSQEALSALFPQHRALIARLTRSG